MRGARKRAGEYEFKWAPPAEDQHDRPGEEWREVQLDCGASRRVSNHGRVITAHGIKTEGTERQRIINILQKLDFHNGDFHHFFEHCAKGLAARY